MPSFPRVCFVDAPAADASVLFDCNTADSVASRYVVDDLSLGAPTLSGEPDAVGQAFGFRTVSFTHVTEGAKADALAALSALSRELMRSRGWLLVQLSATTAPVWFRIYRSGFTPLVMTEVYVDDETGESVDETPDAWQTGVQVVAEPFAYGARVTIPTFTVTQAPSGTNAMRCVLPPIKGDAPTSLRVRVTPLGTNTTAAQYGCEWLLACVSGPAANIADPVVNIGTGDGLTSGTGTGAPVTAAAYFSGDYRLVTIGATGTNHGVLVERLSGSLPITPPQGRYKVLLRCEADAPINTQTPYVFTFGIYEAIGAAATLLPSVTLAVGYGSGFPAETFTGWVDLGEINLPAGVNQLPRDVALGMAQPSVSLQIAVADGTNGAVRIDALKFIPCDGRDLNVQTLKATFLINDPPVGGPSGSNVSATLDGDDETSWITLTTSGSSYVIPGSPALAGAFLTADPAREENLLIVMATADGLGATTPKISDLNAQAAVDVSYHPRFLYLGDGS